MTNRATATAIMNVVNRRVVMGVARSMSFLVPRLQPGNAYPRNSASPHATWSAEIMTADSVGKQSFRDARYQAGVW